MAMIDEKTDDGTVSRTYICDETEIGPLPLYTITYRPGEEWLLFRVESDVPGKEICLWDDDIRELRDELTAMLWCLDEPEDRGW